MKIVGLNHAQITVPTGAEAAARRFYCEVLRLEEIAKPVALQANGGFWLQVGRQQVHVGVEDGVVRQATKAHLAYEVDDLAAWRVYLTQTGVVLLENTPIPGYQRLMLRDPFGNRVELMERLVS